MIAAPIVFLPLYVPAAAADVTVSFNPGTITLASQSFDIDEIQTFNAGTISVSGQNFDVDESVPFNAATITLAGQNFTITGATTIDFNAGLVTMAGKSFDIDEIQTFNAGIITITGTGFDIDETVPFSAGTITIAGQSFTIVGATTIDFSAGAITINGRTFTITEEAVAVGTGIPGGRGRPFAEVPVRTTRGVRRRKIQVFEQEAQQEKRKRREAPIQAFVESLRDVAEITALTKIQQFEEQSFKHELVRIDREIRDKEAVQRAMMIANLEFDLKMAALRRREEELLLMFIIQNVL